MDMSVLLIERAYVHAKTVAILRVHDKFACLLLSSLLGQ